MRWKDNQTELKEKVGQTRKIERFLFLPKCLNGEWRWLEFAEIIQKVTQIGYIVYSCGIVRYEYEWVDKNWGDREE